MEPMGIERHGRSPQVERAGASQWSQREAVRHRRSEAEVADREPGSLSQSIEGQTQARTQAWYHHKSTEIVPGGNGADGNRAT